MELYFMDLALIDIYEVGFTLWIQHLLYKFDIYFIDEGKHGIFHLRMSFQGISSF